MLKPKGNRKQTKIHGVFTVFVMILLCAACGPSVPTVTALPPWTALQQVAVVAPQQQISLLAQGTAAVMAWPTGPGVSALSVWDSRGDLAGRGNPRTLILGTTPRDLTMYPAGGGTLQVLWLDQPLPNQNTLMAALLDPKHNILRGPTTVSNRPALQYAAAVAPDRSLWTFWIGGDSLYAEQIDSGGRPQPPTLIATSAAYPAAAYDVNGTLHVAWLESGGARLWTIHYAAFKSDPVATDGVPAGVLRLKDGEALDDFDLALDSSSVYCLWDTQQISGGLSGQLAGVTFPIGNPNASQTLSISLPADTTIRALAVPPHPSKPLVIGLTVAQRNGSTWQDVPAAMALTPQGSGPLLPVMALGSAENAVNVIGQPAIDQDSSQNMLLAWPTLRSDGTTAVYTASLRSADALTIVATQPLQ